MQKDQSYHESAIRYNEGLAEHAENLAPTLEHEEVRKWCVSVGKQHRFHAKRHRSALNKLLLKQASPPIEQIPDGLDVQGSVQSTSDAEVKADVDEVEVIVEDQTEVNTMDDGCIEFHQPTDPKCTYYPGDDNNG